MNLTRRQEELQVFIGRFAAAHGQAPTIAEIQAALGLKSPATVHEHLLALERAGVIRRIWQRNRGIELLIPYQPTDEREIILQGKVAAGHPIEAILVHETIMAPADMVRRAGTFGLVVSGDSMIGDGILDGDIIVVESCQTAQAGQTVVALINDTEATVKRFYSKRGQIRLEPANPKYKPIIIEPPQTVRIQGVVTGLLRRYKQS